jgi:hypothetical protein
MLLHRSHVLDVELASHLGQLGHRHRLQLRDVNGARLWQRPPRFRRARLLIPVLVAIEAFAPVRTAIRHAIHAISAFVPIAPCIAAVSSSSAAMRTIPVILVAAAAVVSAVAPVAARASLAAIPAVFSRSAIVPLRRRGFALRRLRTLLGLVAPRGVSQGAVVNVLFRRPILFEIAAARFEIAIALVALVLGVLFKHRLVPFAGGGPLFGGCRDFGGRFRRNSAGGFRRTLWGRRIIERQFVGHAFPSTRFARSLSG